MKETILEIRPSEEVSTLESVDFHPEVQNLFSRLVDIGPQEWAEALLHLESFQNHFGLFLKLPLSCLDGSKLYFSRGLKDEIESIYLELARHLRSKSSGSVDLMNAVFEFFTKTLSELARSPILLSMN